MPSVAVAVLRFSCATAKSFGALLVLFKAIGIVKKMAGGAAAEMER